jgi:hypothetical protein
LSQREFESSQLRKQGLLALNGGSEKTDVVQRIRHIFGTNVRYNKSLEDETMPSTISGYEIGRNIACGCNGILFESLKNQRRFILFLLIIL